ncbi:hypothetical protein G7Y79_00012g032410 [Physcia stellaris]|nr:hypothetical protein G7Y79_00012g032410 [Physcia stellaris]
MPGKELSDPMQTQNPPTFALLKSHKTFPRRQAPPVEPTASMKHSLLQRQQKEQMGLAKSAEIESWIPEPDVIHLTLSHSLPLTPPSYSPEEGGTSWIDGPLPDDNKVTTRSVSSGINTPVIQRSPPTPETTPPRARQQLPALLPLADQRNQSSGTRTDSFKTAREELSSDDDGRQIKSPSMQPSRQRWLRQTAHERLRGFGLGLGLESDDEDVTPHKVNPKSSSRKDNFPAFDGSWESSQDYGAAFYDAKPTPRGLLKKTTPRVSTQSPSNTTSATEDATALAKTLSLRQRLEQRRQSPTSASTARVAEDIKLPLQDNDDVDHNTKVHEMDNPRFSQMSGTSTVEAIVIENLSPKRRQTLRHTGKIVSLDLPSNESRPSSIALQYDRPQRRQLRHAGSPEQVKRGSVASDVSIGITTCHLKSRQDSIPVIVIPERKSSLTSSPPSIRRLSRTTSLTPRQRSSRPTTAPDETLGYFDVPHRERRTVSAIIPIATATKPKATGAKDVHAATGTEPIAVSANTSRKVSRAASSTSPGGMSFNGLQEHPTNPHGPPTIRPFDESQDAPTHNAQSTNFDKATMAEWSALRPRSTQVTPFSVRSAHSSTPGTLEVNEATAISIYPHTNRSILVVQQLARRNSQPPEHSAIVASNASFAIPGPHAPAIIHQTRTRNLLDSPLRNPREPPQPPDFKVIPPTPVPNFSPTRDNERTPRQPAAKSAMIRLSRPITIVKRALSARRYSETFISPLTRGLSRRATVTERRRSSHDPESAIDPENKLHPFWRPRGFWDDLSDSDTDSEFGNSGYLVGNSLGMPGAHTTTKITAQQPPRRSASLSQRLSNSMRFPRGRSSAVGRRHSVAANSRRIYQRTTYESNHEANRSYEFIQPQPDSRNQSVMPRQGYQVHFVGLKGLAERMEKRKERRGEEKRERVREKLRGSIGAVVPTQGGAAQGWGQAGYLRGL